MVELQNIYIIRELLRTLYLIFTNIMGLAYSAIVD